MEQDHRGKHVTYLAVASTSDLGIGKATWRRKPEDRQQTSCHRCSHACQIKTLGWVHWIALAKGEGIDMLEGKTMSRH